MLDATFYCVMVHVSPHAISRYYLWLPGVVYFQPFQESCVERVPENNAGCVTFIGTDNNISEYIRARVESDIVYDGIFEHPSTCDQRKLSMDRTSKLLSARPGTSR